MTTPLAQAIDALSDPDVTVAAALRRMLVVAYRIGVTDLVTMMNSELDGYSPDVAIPGYRSGAGLSVTVRFDGYGGSVDHMNLSAPELPNDLSGTLTGLDLRQPVAELSHYRERSDT